jgi:acetyl-CoA acetyltransferase
VQLEDETQTGTEGGKLRDQLEQALADVKRLKDENHRYKTTEVLTAKGFDLVQPEDLDGVKAEEIEARAKEIQDKRVQLQTDLLRKALEKQGFQGEQLDEMVTAFAGTKQSESEEADQVKRARQAGAAEGTPAPKVDTQKLTGLEAIRAGIK